MDEWMNGWPDEWVVDGVWGWLLLGFELFPGYAGQSLQS
jgi:hypothetical protein